MRRRIFFPVCNGYTVIRFVMFAGADGFGLAVASWLPDEGERDGGDDEDEVEHGAGTYFARVRWVV